METRRHRRSESGAIVFGLALLLIGGYYLLERTFGMALPELDWDRLWPVILIVFGGVVVWRAYRDREA